MSGAAVVDMDQIKECVANARAFLKCVKRVLDCPDGGLIDVLLSPMANVVVVNSALACELFIKAIAALESGNMSMPRGHELLNLFNSMTPQSQRFVKDCFDPDNRKRFSECLKEVSSAFVDWRYSHEASVSAYPLFLVELGDALDKRVVSIQKSLV